MVRSSLFTNTAPCWPGRRSAVKNQARLPIVPMSSRRDAAPAWTWERGTSWEGARPGWKVVAGTVHFYPGNKCTGNIFDLQQDGETTVRRRGQKSKAWWLPPGGGKNKTNRVWIQLNLELVCVCGYFQQIWFGKWDMKESRTVVQMFVPDRGFFWFPHLFSSSFIPLCMSSHQLHPHHHWSVSVWIIGLRFGEFLLFSFLNVYLSSDVPEFDSHLFSFSLFYFLQSLFSLWKYQNTHITCWYLVSCWWENSIH